MKLALIMALPLSAFALVPAMADGLYRERIAPVYLCRDGSAVSTYGYQDPRYVCALRERAQGEYLARVEDMRFRQQRRNVDTLRAIDEKAYQNGW